MLWKYELAKLLNAINRAHQGIVIGIPETEVLGVLCTGENLAQEVLEVEQRGSSWTTAICVIFCQII